jgi:hypothetical protein
MLVFLARAYLRPPAPCSCLACLFFIHSSRTNETPLPFTPSPQISSSTCLSSCGLRTNNYRDVTRCCHIYIGPRLAFSFLASIALIYSTISCASRSRIAACLLIMKNLSSPLASCYSLPCFAHCSITYCCTLSTSLSHCLNKPNECILILFPSTSRVLFLSLSDHANARTEVSNPLAAHMQVTNRRPLPMWLMSR